MRCAVLRPRLGQQGVDQNPMIVFSMFCFVVILTVIVETGKHAIEHKTKDKYRREALG
eukprot:gene38732-54584_t